MLTIKKIGLVLLLGISIISNVQALPVDELQAFLKPVLSLKAKFQQTVIGKQSKVIQKSTGNMEFKRPNLFRWQIETPDPNLIVTDGKKMWNYDVELEQVTVQNFKSSTEVSPISFLLDDVEQLNKDFEVVKLKDRKNHFKLTPKQENSSFVFIEITFVQSKIKQLRLLDHLGQTSVFDFDQVQNNPKIANDRFTFVPPVGIDVIGE